MSAKIPAKTAAFAAPRGAQEEGVSWEEIEKTVRTATSTPSDYGCRMTSSGMEELKPQKMEEPRVCAVADQEVETATSECLNDDEVTQDHCDPAEPSKGLPPQRDPDLLELPEEASNHPTPDGGSVMARVTDRVQPP